jgi:chromosome segregation ATPase
MRRNLDPLGQSRHLGGDFASSVASRESSLEKSYSQMEDPKFSCAEKNLLMATCRNQEKRATKNVRELHGLLTEDKTEFDDVKSYGDFLKDKIYSKEIELESCFAHIQKFSRKIKNMSDIVQDDTEELARSVSRELAKVTKSNAKVHELLKRIETLESCSQPEKRLLANPRDRLFRTQFFDDKFASGLDAGKMQPLHCWRKSENLF